MFKPSTFRKFLPVASIVALALLVVLGVAAGLRRHSGSAVTQRAAAPSTQTPSAEQNARVRASMQTLPLAFEANQGQTDPQVKYMARGTGYTVFLTANDTVFALRSGSRASTAGPARHQAAAGTLPPATKDRTAAIHMHLAGGNPQAQIIAGSELPGRSNYFIGPDRSRWHANVAQFARVSYRDAYPGVNLAFYGAQKQLEFDFIVAAGASPAPIRFDISGAIRIVTDPQGNLLLASSAGDVLFHKPVAYQQKDGVREPVDARFVLQAKNQVSFELGNYDHSRELVIDPSVGYATYLGGSLEDDGYGIAVDGSGNAYVTGQTASIDFPTTAGVYSGSNKGSFDVFVTKVKPDGSGLVYSTYVGGSGSDSGNAIAVDGSGNAFVAGGASAGFPTTGSAYQQTFQGGAVDAFVFELAASGGTLTYSTYLGGTGDDVANGIALDGAGNAYVVGSTGSGNFPVHNPIQSSLVGTSNGFVTKLNSSGNALVYSTFLGGDGDFATAVALNSSDAGFTTGSTPAYVTGATQTSTFPTTAGAFQTSCGTQANCNGGLDDAFVSVFNAAGSGFVYSTFLGGGRTDQGLGIAVDSSGDAYVTGFTQSTDFPTKNPAFSTIGGTQDAFVAAFSPTGSALSYSTYLGGSLADAAAGIAVDMNQNAYVTGLTGSTDFPVGHATQGTSGGANDAFVTEIRSSGTLVFSTYLGGSANEDSRSAGGSVSPVGAIAVNSAGANIYVTGNTASSNFPATSGAFQTTIKTAGIFDAFVVKYSTGAANNNFSIADGALSVASGNPGVSATSTITVTSTSSTFSSAVALTCAVTPVVSHGPTCGFNPSSVTPPANGNVTATLTVNTTATSALLERPSNGPSSGIFYAMFLPIGGVVLLGGLGSSGTRRKKLFGLLMLGVVLTGLLLMPACGGSSSSKTSGTPAGAYTITVTGTSGAATATGTPALTLTVN